MVNTLLVSLTNRTTGFYTESLNVFQKFKEDKDSDFVELRQILTKDIPEMGILLAQTLYYDPYAALICPPGIVSSDLTDLDVAYPFVEGARLVANATGPARMPMAIGGGVVTVSYATEGVVRIKTDTTSEVASVIPFPLPDGSTLLDIEWPIATKINGDLLISTAYEPGMVVKMTMKKKYPYEEVCHNIESSSAAFEALLKTNLADAYHFADSEKYKVCIAALAVYKHFNSIQED